MKNLKNLGIILTKNEQKQISGGVMTPPPKPWCVCHNVVWCTGGGLDLETSDTYSSGAYACGILATGNECCH